jgi:inorganic pyrophosphatase
MQEAQSGCPSPIWKSYRRAFERTNVCEAAQLHLSCDSQLEMNALLKLPPRNGKSGTLNVVIDTPKGCRNKFAFDLKMKTYVLKTVLPEGHVFPFDFGSITGTKAEDGDPVDALVLMDEPAFPGCLIEARAIGVIQAEQTEKNKTQRNDRIIAVAVESHTHRGITSLSDLDSTLVDEIEQFFISYNKTRGKKFKPIARRGPKGAMKVVKKHQVL